MKIRGIATLVILVLGISASAQYTKEFKRIFFDAEYLYQTGFYEESFNRYKNLLTLDPGNHNILFHCGACCLNIPGNEKQAVTYLEEASAGVTLDYKDRSHKEPGSPVLTYFMLGRAHHLNNSFEAAITAYELYQNAAADKDPLQVEYAGLQVEACWRASEVVREAPSFEFQSVLDQFDDDLPSCNNPVISGDGNILIFHVDYPNDKKIMMAEKNGQYWTRPRVINSELGMVGETRPACLSYDGEDLYLVHDFYSHSDIFVSRYQGGRWSEAEGLGYSINGRTSENHASISKDEKTLYFTSDARGGEGSFDIWVSHLNNKGEWGDPENLGADINTRFEEHTPFISSNDSILFFSSQGHSSIGGIDVFYSELQTDGSWGEPRSLGYPVNTTGDNVFFNPGWNELDGYYAVQRLDDPTSNTINMVIELEPPPLVAEAELKDAEEEPPALVQEQENKEVLTDPRDFITAGDPEEKPPLPVTMEEKPSLELEEVIEPEDTEEIHQVLNKNRVDTVESPPVEADSPVTAGSTALETALPFEHNAFEMTMAAMLEAEKVADLMQKYSSSSVLLTGRADATGPSEYNYLLSGQRAAAIADYLEMRGVERSRISLENKGEDAPVALNAYSDGSDAPLGRYLNRQVSVLLENAEPMNAGLTGFYVPESLKAEGGAAGSDSGYWFTIQIAASLVKESLSDYKELGEVKEYSCKDGYYRYSVGKFREFVQARYRLEEIRKSGYPDAFIQTLSWYDEAAR